ncbi:MAG: GAP family protein [Acidimicrobiia bacterium]
MLVDLTIIGLAVTLEPLPLTAFILVLGVERGTRKGLAFLLSWFGCLVVVIGAVVLLTGGKPLKSQSAPSTTALVIKLLLGVVLILLGFRQRARMGLPRKPTKWMARLDGLSTPSAAVLGPLLQPWALVAAGAATVATAKLSNVWEYLSLLFFCLLSSGTLIAMQLYVSFRPVAAKGRLDSLKGWIDAHTAQATVVLAFLVGTWLVGHSAYLLATA